MAVPPANPLTVLRDRDEESGTPVPAMRRGPSPSVQPAGMRRGYQTEPDYRPQGEELARIMNAPKMVRRAGRTYMMQSSKVVKYQKDQLKEGTKFVSSEVALSRTRRTRRPCRCCRLLGRWWGLRGAWWGSLTRRAATGSHGYEDLEEAGAGGRAGCQGGRAPAREGGRQGGRGLGTPADLAALPSPPRAAVGGCAGEAVSLVLRVQTTPSSP
jgi:hypothetical protein